MPMPKPFPHLLLLVLLLAIPGMARSEPTKALEVSYSLDSPITLHEPAIVQVTIQNVSSHGITIDLGWRDVAAFLFRVSTPEGNHVDIPPQDYRRGDIVMSGVAKYLKPQGKFSERIILNEWDIPEGLAQPSANLIGRGTFNVPGNYQIAAKLAVPTTGKEPSNPWISEDDHPKIEVAETVLNLTILPRNEIVLKQRCENLIRRLRVAHRYDESYPIAKELSYVNDPAAISYLVMLVKETEELLAIEGLTRIGTDEAWEAMIEVTKSKYDKEAAKYAKAILRRKVFQIHDPSIRKKVEAAIGESH